MDDYLSGIATFVLLSGLIPSLAFSFTYGLGSPWYRSPLGAIMLTLMLSLDATFIFVVSRRLYGDYPGYGFLALSVYSVVVLALWGIYIVLLIERRKPQPQPLSLSNRKDTMTHSIDEAAPSILDKLAEYRKGIAAFLTPIVIVVGSSLTEGSDGGSAITATEWVTIALAALGTGGIVTAVRNRQPRGVIVDEDGNESDVLDNPDAGGLH